MQFQVSAITARRAFDELDRAGLITRKRFIGTMARDPSRRTKLLPVTLVAPHESHDAAPDWYRMEIQRGIMDAARQNDIRVKFIQASLVSPAITNTNLLLTTELSLNNDAKADIYSHNRILKTYCPKVDPQCACVRPDFQKGIELAARHLLALGHRRIAMILIMIANPWQTCRFDGYARILKRQRIPWDWDLVKECENASADGVNRGLRQLFALAHPPTAILCGNDAIAALTLNYCREINLRIPDQISVTGFDNVPESATTDPPLTTVDPQLYQTGFTAMTELARRARGGIGQRVDVLIRPKLIVRRSTASVGKT